MSKYRRLEIPGVENTKIIVLWGVMLRSLVG
jgi:hypothetical protein